MSRQPEAACEPKAGWLHPHVRLLAPLASAERLALPALGRERRSHPTRKMLRRRKLPENAQNPQRQVHALLGGFFTGLAIFLATSVIANLPIHYEYYLI